MRPELERWLRLELPTREGVRSVELRVPRMADVADLLGEDGERHVHVVAAWLPGFIQEMVHSVGAQAMSFELADQLAGDPDFARGLVRHTRTMLDTLRERGQVLALCPRCGLWEAELSIQAYALVAADPLPSAFDGPVWRSPWMGTPSLPGAPRPHLPRAAAIRVVMPSAGLGLPGSLTQATLGEIRPQPEEHGSPRPGDDDYDLDHARTGPGWRALLRLARALVPALDSEAADGLPLLDFLFLDLVHYLVDRAPVRPNSQAMVACPRCDMRFLPVRRDLILDGWPDAR